MANRDLKKYNLVIDRHLHAIGMTYVGSHNRITAKQFSTSAKVVAGSTRMPVR
jgi:hypothetical protein